MNDLLASIYPEKNIAGFCRNDHRITFYTQVNALLTPDMRVLDFGAGRGKWAETESGYKLKLTTLRGKCSEVIGCDTDEIVKSNPLVDRGVVMRPDEKLPFDNESFDLIVSWAVFEHIANPAHVASELTRVLKPGGWLCAWTPSRWSYFALAAQVIPNRLHGRLVAIAEPGGRKEKDVFPTVYKLNTLPALRKHFSPTEWDHYSYYYNGPPAYHAGSRTLASLWRSWMWLLPGLFAQQIHVFMHKR